MTWGVVALFTMLVVMLAVVIVRKRGEADFRSHPDAADFGFEKTRPFDGQRYFRKRQLLTLNELETFHYLRGKLPPSVFVCPCVRIADIVGVKPGKGHMSAFGRISQKHVDFLVVDFESHMLFAVEVDDLSHQRPDRKERDAFVDDLFRSVNVPLIRVEPRRLERSEALRTALAQFGVHSPPGQQ